LRYQEETGRAEELTNFCKMDNIINWLTKAWKEHSIIFLFLSAAIGGIVGASIKLIFEYLIPERFKTRKEALAIINRYSPPLVQSAEALRGRIANLLQMIRFNWFEKSEYYKLSTLYVFCSFFAWLEILFGKLSLLHFKSSRKQRRLTSIINGVEKAFNNRIYFGDLKFSKIRSDTDVPKFVCKALGELMVKSSNKDNSSPIEFVEFCKQCRSNRDFKDWLDNLCQFLSGVQRSPDNLKWDRLLIIELSLFGLINYLDPRHKITKKFKTKQTIGIASSIERKHAKEMLSEDFVRKKLPVKVEERRKRFARRWRLILGGKYKWRPLWLKKKKKVGEEKIERVLS